MRIDDNNEATHRPHFSLSFTFRQSPCSSADIHCLATTRSHPLMTNNNVRLCLCSVFHYWMSDCYCVWESFVMNIRHIMRFNLCQIYITLLYRLQTISKYDNIRVLSLYTFIQKVFRRLMYVTVSGAHLFNFFQGIYRGSFPSSALF